MSKLEKWIVIGVEINSLCICLQIKLGFSFIFPRGFSRVRIPRITKAGWDTLLTGSHLLLHPIFGNNHRSIAKLWETPKIWCVFRQIFSSKSPSLLPLETISTIKISSPESILHNDIFFSLSEISCELWWETMSGYCLWWTFPCNIALFSCLNLSPCVKNLLLTLSWKLCPPGQEPSHLCVKNFLSPQTRRKASASAPDPTVVTSSSASYRQFHSVTTTLYLMEKRIPQYLKGKGIDNEYSPPPRKRIRAPELDNSDLIRENELTLIGGSLIQRLKDYGHSFHLSPTSGILKEKLSVLILVMAVSNSGLIMKKISKRSWIIDLTILINGW